MSSDRTIILAGGGSGGHLYPGIAVAQALADLAPDVRPLFLCTERDIDRTILEPTGYEFIPQPIVPPRRSVGGLLRFWTKWRATADLVKKVVAQRKPAAVLGLGGYAAGVAVKFGGKGDLPVAILNPDVIPGKANQYLTRYCQRIFCGFESTQSHVPQEIRDRFQTVGCPLRREFASLPAREEAAERLGLDSRLNTLVVTGASQGARTVNDAVLEVVKQIVAGGRSHPLQGWQILHLAGHDHAETVRAEYRALDLDSIATVVDFTPGMDDVWAVADLAVSRSGASSCFELLAAGVPSVLMPYPFHKDRHQTANARELEKAGAATVLEDLKKRGPNAQKLREALEPLLYDAPRRRQMANAARSAARPDAAEAVARELVKMIG